MAAARVRLEHMPDREGPVNRWILECPHGRWFADQRAETAPTTKAAVIHDVLLPKHDQAHDPACTQRLRDQYGPGSVERD